MRPNRVVPLGIGVIGQFPASPCRVYDDKTLQGFGAGAAAIRVGDLVEKKFSVEAAVRFRRCGQLPRPQAAALISSRFAGQLPFGGCQRRLTVFISRSALNVKGQIYRQNFLASLDREGLCFQPEVKGRKGFILYRPVANGSWLPRGPGSAFPDISIRISPLVWEKSPYCGKMIKHE